MAFDGMGGEYNELPSGLAAAIVHDYRINRLTRTSPWKTADRRRKGLSTMACLFALHALATIMMAGLIWFVQLVHYPLFSFIGADNFARYELEHTRRVTWIVAPLMGLEALTAVALVFLVDGGTIRVLAIVGVVVLAAIWVSTALLQAPCHKKLSSGFDHPTARRLVATNWMRTVAWTVRAVLALLIPAMMQS